MTKGQQKALLKPYSLIENSSFLRVQLFVYIDKASSYEEDMMKLSVSFNKLCCVVPGTGEEKTSNLEFIRL